MAYTVFYFDGKTSKTHTAKLAVNSLNWKISFVNNLGVEITKNWEISKIKRSKVYTKDIVTFTYGNKFPFQRIESKDPKFLDYINNHQQKNINSVVNTQLHKYAKKSIFLLLTTIIGLSIFIYFFIIPYAANSFAANVTNKNVKAFGNYIFKVLSTDLDIDDEKSKKLQSFVDEMKIETTFPLTVYVANSDQINAFAISGGKIVVFSSLLEKIENQNQLAALIGHEISHIEKRHALKGISRNLSGILFVSIIFGDINSITAILTENAHLFSQLSFSRDLEKEADIYGLEIMRKNNLDLNGMPELFAILKKASKINVPTFLNNHPMLKDRIDYTLDVAKNQKETPKNVILEEKWLILKNTFQKNE